MAMAQVDAFVGPGEKRRARAAAFDVVTKSCLCHVSRYVDCYWQCWYPGASRCRHVLQAASSGLALNERKEKNRKSYHFSITRWSNMKRRAIITKTTNIQGHSKFLSLPSSMKLRCFCPIRKLAA